VYVAALFLLNRLVGGYAAAGICAAAVGAAFFLDALAEVRFRREQGDVVCIWSEHRPYAIEPLRAARASAHVPVVMRSWMPRRLLQFVAPFVPIEVLVPAAYAERATAIAQKLLMPRPRDARRYAALEDVPASRPSLRALALAAGALVALAGTYGAITAY